MLRYVSVILKLLVLSSLSLSFAAQAQLNLRQQPSLGGQPVPLPVGQAFPFFVSIDGPGQLSVTWQPAPQHYLYRHQFAFYAIFTPGGNRLPLDFSMPAGLPRSDQFFGEIEAFYDPVTAQLTLPDTGSRPTRLEIHYQGCVDWGFCYLPQVVIYPLLQ